MAQREKIKTAKLLLLLSFSFLLLLLFYCEALQTKPDSEYEWVKYAVLLLLLQQRFILLDVELQMVVLHGFNSLLIEFSDLHEEELGALGPGIKGTKHHAMILLMANNKNRA